MRMKRVRRLVHATAAALLWCLACEAGHAGTLSLVDSPLYLGSGVKPNLIMAIDDSGSMDFELLLRANDGAAWWRTGNPSGSCPDTTGKSFTGCTANGSTDLPATGVLNFANAGNSSGTWKKFAYLFPNGYNVNNNSDQRRLGDSDNDHFAIPPLPAYAWSRSPDYNHAYFNPSTSYIPWPDGGGLTFVNAVTTATRYDAVYSTSGKTIDLTRDFAGTAGADTTASCSDSLPGGDTNYYFRVFDGMALPAGTCFYPTGVDGTYSKHWQTAGTGGCVIQANSGCVSSLGTYQLPDNRSVAIRYFPATFYLKSATSLPANFGYTGATLTGWAPDGTALTGYQIKSANFASTAQYNAAIQNFANWFQYYRKRHQALRGGLGSAFTSVTNTRVAGFTINTTQSATSPDLTMQDIDIAANRTALYTQFYQTWTGQGGTPNRPAVANVVRNYKRTGSTAPIQYACQQNFGMLFTDGFANPLASGDGFDTIGNVDGNKGSPYADTVSNTMADGIMDAYANNLRPDLTTGKVPVPAACGTTGAAASLDCNKNPHMNFFAITLGTKGLQFDSNNPVDPYTASPAIVWPTSDQLSQTRNPVAVDDLWHATLNGHGALLNANSPADVADKLASVLNSIAARVGSGAAVAVNSGSISSNSSKYQVIFNSSTWNGDLVSIPINPDGTDGSPNNWTAAGAMPAAGTRQIFSVNSDGTAVPFRWASLDSTRQGQLQQTDTAAIATARVDYLRGDHSKEQQSGGTFRNRVSALGDVIDSAPVYVSISNFRYPDAIDAVSYSSFLTQQVQRVPTIYFGANDGMMHAVRADTGVELFAFIPGGVFNNLYRLTQPLYAHRYFVDGAPAATDAFFGGKWHTVLTAGLNAGGQSVFALDVTKPDGYSESSTTTPFLWEFTDAQNADLGYTFSRPLVVRLSNNRWVAIFGNGYNNTVTDTHPSSTGNAVLYIVDVETGALLQKIDTGVGMAQDPTGQSRPNGLSSPATIDVNGDGNTDYVYAGDLFGNLWKFNVADPAPANWKVAYTSGSSLAPIFVAKDAAGKRQPITMKPSVSRGPNGQGLIVAFGTGKYLEASDSVVSNLTTQTIYGIYDKNAGTISDIVPDRSQANVALTQQTIIYDAVTSFTKADGTTVSSSVRVVSKNPIGSNRGWYLDLISPVSGFQGEMQVTDFLLINGQLNLASLIPNSDPCSGGGKSPGMTIDLMTGGRTDTPPFDLNGDHVFDSHDMVTLPDGTKVTVSGVVLDVGIGSKPTLLSSNDTASSGGGTGTGGGGGGPNKCDYLIFAGSNGQTETICKNPGPRAVGRQSWRQVR